MGLDMYLSKKTYVRNWDHQKPEERHEVIIKKGGEIRKDIKPERITNIVEEVGYWRKFNALHRWFVETVQNGNDDCGTYYVDHSKLEELLKILEEVSARRGEYEENELVAQKLLPTAQGFFFGSDDYDDWYYEYVKETITIVKECLADKSGSYYYDSSW